MEAQTIYTALSRVVWLAAGIWLAFWFLDSIMIVVLFFLVAVVMAMALNPVVSWLERHRLPRVAGTLGTLAGIGLFIGLLGWLIVPELTDQVTALLASLPNYVAELTDRARARLAEHPDIAERVQVDAGMLSRALPTVQTFIGRIGRYSFNLLAFVIMVLATLSMALYMVVNPRPLIRGMLLSLPVVHREPATQAMVKSSQMVSAWIRSNLIVGSLEAVAAWLFLSWLGIPGALIWGAFTFFAELVPKISTYLMPIPAILVALAIDPVKALWVLLFYMALNEITGDFVAPYVRGSQMDLHPVLLIVFVLAMGVAFGFVGALMATPLAGIAKAFYESFYLDRQPRNDQLERQVERIASSDA